MSVASEMEFKYPLMEFIYDEFITDEKYDNVWKTFGEEALFQMIKKLAIPQDDWFDNYFELMETPELIQRFLNRKEMLEYLDNEDFYIVTYYGSITELEDNYRTWWVIEKGKVGNLMYQLKNDLENDLKIRKKFDEELIPELVARL